MNTLSEMVSGLDDGLYKKHFVSHIERGMHPSEEMFARYALLALAPGVVSSQEKEESAKYILEVSLQNLPSTRSGEIFAENLKQRFPQGVLLADLQIEEMIFISNIASCISAAGTRALETEQILEEQEAELLRLATVSGRRPALPVVIEEGLFWLYYMGRDLRGVCIHSLPGKGQGLPVVFACSDYSADNTDHVLQVACHEMIHSSQGASVQEHIEGWSDNAKQALLEAITEGLTICRIGKRSAFSAEEITRRDYVYFVVALFAEMRKAEIDPKQFPAELERLNGSLQEAASLLGSPEEFLRRAKTTAQALVLQQIRMSSSPEGLRQKDALDFLGTMLFSGDGGLQIIDEVLLAQSA